MKIRMNTAIAGPGLSISIGEETEAFSEDEALRMIAKGMAEEVIPPKPRTKARAKKGA